MSSYFSVNKKIFIFSKFFFPSGPVLIFSVHPWGFLFPHKLFDLADIELLWNEFSISQQADYMSLDANNTISEVETEKKWLPLPLNAQEKMWFDQFNCVYLKLLDLASFVDGLLSPTQTRRRSHATVISANTPTGVWWSYMFIQFV